MNIKTIAFFFLSPFLLSSNSHSAIEVEPKMFVLCKLGSIVRSIQVNKVGDGFETYYTKNGETKSIGSGKMYDSTVGFLNNVRVNLEKNGWACKEVGEVSVTGEASAE